DPVPGAVLAQLAVTTPHRLPGTELSWHIPPWRAGPEAPDDALHDRPVITEGPPTLRRRLRHQRLDPSPRNVRENLSTRHTPSLRRRSPESYETRPSRPATSASRSHRGPHDRPSGRVVEGEPGLKQPPRQHEQ